MGQEAMNLGARQVVLLGLCTPGNYLKVMRRVANNNDFIFVNGQAHIKGKLPEIIAGELHPDIVLEMKDSYPLALRQNSLFYITSDGCHPNTLGHRLIGEELVEAIAHPL